MYWRCYWTIWEQYYTLIECSGASLIDRPLSLKPMSPVETSAAGCFPRGCCPQTGRMRSNAVTHLSWRSRSERRTLLRGSRSPTRTWWGAGCRWRWSGTAQSSRKTSPAWATARLRRCKPPRSRTWEERTDVQSVAGVSAVSRVSGVSRIHHATLFFYALCSCDADLNHLYWHSRKRGYLCRNQQRCTSIGKRQDETLFQTHVTHRWLGQPLSFRYVSGKWMLVCVNRLNKCKNRVRKLERESEGRRFQKHEDVPVWCSVDPGGHKETSSGSAVCGNLPPPLQHSILHHPPANSTSTHRPLHPH